MATRVDVSDIFKKDLKKLARKYPAILDQVEALIDDLEADKRSGDKIPNVGFDVYKVRLKNPSTSRGKRGGFRVIYYVHLKDEVFLLTVYSKSQQSDVSLEQIRRIIVDLMPPQSTTPERDPSG
jgi:mRNA-degrading endonuclease RelE of RelBE toxin-antitoxin system